MVYRRSCSRHWAIRRAQVQHDAKAIQAKDIKIEALTHELAHIRRIRYGVKSETLSPAQRDVFEETWNTDVSAIEAEVEHLHDHEPCDTVAKPKMAHSLNPVPAIVYDPSGAANARLADVPGAGIANLAATCINLLGFEAPEDYAASLVELG